MLFMLNVAKGAETPCVEGTVFHTGTTFNIQQNSARIPILFVSRACPLQRCAIMIRLLTLSPRPYLIIMKGNGSMNQAKSKEK